MILTLVFGVGVSCRNLYSFVVYLYVNCSGSITRLGKRELICLLLFTCNYVVSVWRGFLFLWVLGMGCIILLWHSMGLSYNYFEGWIWVLIASVPDLAYFLLSLIFILGSCTSDQCKAILLYNNSAMYLHNLYPISCGIVYKYNLPCKLHQEHAPSNSL